MELLKPGGVLVYSTCTITMDENEKQVEWALRKFPCLKLDAQVSLNLFVFNGFFFYWLDTIILGWSIYILGGHIS